MLSYKNVLCSFYEFAIHHFDTQHQSLQHINKLSITTFLNHKNYAPITKKQYLTILKIFFNFITDENTNAYSFKPLFHKMNIKTPHKLPTHLSPGEITKIIHYIKQHLLTSTSFIKQRNALLLHILIYGGVRVSELLNIKWQDMVYHSKDHLYAFKVTGKGNKQRWVYIPDHIQELPLTPLLVNLQDRKYDLIFATHKGHRIDRFNIYKMTKRLFKTLHINKTGVHIFRHSLATSLVNKEVNLSTIKEVLGHSNISTTMIYAKSNETNKQKAIKALVG